MSPTTADAAIDHPMAGPTVMETLRASTREAHEAAETTGFSRAMMAQRLSLPAFVEFLRCLRIVHRGLESALDASADPVVRAVWSSDRARAGELDRDVADLEERMVESGLVEADAGPAAEAGRCDEARAAAEALVASIEADAIEHPTALLGHLYVLEGSRLGGAVLRPRIEAAYGLDDGRGLAYHPAGGPAVATRWKAFKSRMEEAVRCHDESQTMVTAARRSFEGVTAITRSIGAPAPEVVEPR